VRTPQQALADAIASGAVQAWIDGKRIQVKQGADTWESFTGNWPSVANPQCFWRPAPTPKLRPWRPEEVPVGAQIRHSDWDGKNYGRFAIAGVDRDTISWMKEGGFGVTTLQNLIENNGYSHSTDGGKTWLPCGVMEGGE